MKDGVVAFAQFRRFIGEGKSEKSGYLCGKRKYLTRNFKRLLVAEKVDAKA